MRTPASSAASPSSALGAQPRTRKARAAWVLSEQAGAEAPGAQSAEGTWTCHSFSAGDAASSCEFTGAMVLNRDLGSTSHQAPHPSSCMRGSRQHILLLA